VGASVTDHTVIKEGKTKKRVADLKVGDHVWMKFERVSSGDIAPSIIIKRGEKQE
jgi:ERCC4-type nuclease